MLNKPTACSLARLLTFILLVGGCATDTQSSSPSPTTVRVTTTTKAPATTQAPTTTRAPTTTAPSCSIDDEARDLVREWNRVSTELLASYMDASGVTSRSLPHSERLMPKLNRVVQDLRYLRECLPTDELVAFEPFLGTYNDKLSGYSALGNAVRLGSGEMEETAVEMLMAANAESMAMVCEIARITGERLPGADVC